MGKIREFAARGHIWGSNLKEDLKGKLRDESGASAVEYSMLVGAVVVAVIAAGKIFGGSVSGAFEALGNTVSGIIGGK